ncbi:MAG: valine--tRNA ligase [Pirellulales bacterium]
MSAELNAENLPNRFDYKTAEPRLYASWEQRGYFHSEPDPQRKPFTIVIPPPNVTGALHLGHALNNTLQDVMIRLKRMQGFNCLWMPGTDHAGIATQAVVEKRLREEEGKTRHDLGREKLVERIWQWKAAYEARILGQLKQLGASCDWQRTRFTLDDMCARAVRQTFFDLFGQQLIYRGKRLVNWDTFLQTAVSDDEVFHETVPGNFWHFRYPVIDPQPGEPDHVTIATTRPETMLGDTAVAVHPRPGAALDEVETNLLQRLAAAAEKDKPALQQSLDDVRQRRQTMLVDLEKLSAMARAGRRLMLPLLNREIPLVADEWAKPELGSGCVKITPAHDPNDYEVGRRCSLPMINILNRDGTLNEQAGPYAGLTIAAARKRVVQDLDTLGLLEKTEDREIDLAHSDRSKTPIEPFLADQWFVRMDRLGQSAMDAVQDGRVQIHPSRYAKGYLDWLSEKRDWPVSRQLWWGHRIPVWTIMYDPASLSKGLSGLLEFDAPSGQWRVPAALRSKLSVSRPESGDSAETTLFVCVAPGNEDLERQLELAGAAQEQDTLDTWFSSALWTHSTLGWPEKTPELAYYYPTDVLITSRDIITLWVARMVLTGLNNMGEVPFKDVFIHPKILDGYGETMSKSKGNGVDPIDVIEKFGADALRFGLAHLTTETQDVRMPVQFECPHCQTLIDQTKENREKPVIACSKCAQKFSTQWARQSEDLANPRGAVVSDRFELARNFSNKLWNVARLTLMNLQGYTAQPVKHADLMFEDRWVLSRLSTVSAGVTEALDNFRFAEATRLLYDFAWDEFCSFYAEMAKRRLDDPQQRPVAQRVIAYVLDTLLRLLHPFMPFLTEEIWLLLNRAAPQRGLESPAPAAESLMIATWPQARAEHQDIQLETQFSRFQSVLGALREIRSRQGVAPRQEVRFAVQCSDQDRDLLVPMTPYFASMAWATSLGWGRDVTPPPTNAQVALGDLTVFIDLTGLIDIPAEIARNQKQAEKLQQLIRGKEGKLSNESFVSRAPADVVAKEREGLEDLRQQLRTVEAALAALSRA